MFPRFSFNNIHNSHPTYFVNICNLGIILKFFIKFSYSNNASFSKLLPFSAVMFSVSSFFYKIKNIISLCSKEKVVRVYAEFLVAFMKYKKVVRYFSKFKFPRNTMARLCFSIPGHATVSANVCRSYPKPTVSSLINFIEKSWFDRFAFAFCKTRNTSFIVFVRYFFEAINTCPTINSNHVRYYGISR